jgi:glycosyltransferase involved in cell wall biosynthesis
LIEQWDLEKTQRTIKPYHNILNIKLLYSKDKSLAKARNIWIKHAQGELIFFTDDDVVFDQKYIEIAIIFFEKNKEILWATWKDILNTKSPNYVWMFFGFLFCLSKLNETWKILKSGHNTYYSYSDKERYIESLCWCSMMFRREIINKKTFNSNFTKWSFGEDVYWSYKIFKKFWPKCFKYVPQLKYKHYHSKESRLKNSSLIKMKIIYRYIFWKDNVYSNNIFNLFCYIWSQVWLLLLEFFYKKTQMGLSIHINSYIYLIKNYKKIDKNTINYNSFITK